MSNIFTKVLVKNKINQVPEESVNWVDLWKRAKGNSNPNCSNLTSCPGTSKEIVGGHVYKVDKQGKAIEPGVYYIVPLCKSCNSRSNTAPFEVYEYRLVKESYLLDLNKKY